MCGGQHLFTSSDTQAIRRRLSVCAFERSSLGRCELLCCLREDSRERDLGLSCVSGFTPSPTTSPLLSNSISKLQI